MKERAMMTSKFIPGLQFPNTKKHVPWSCWIMIDSIWFRETISTFCKRQI